MLPFGSLNWSIPGDKVEQRCLGAGGESEGAGPEVGEWCSAEEVFWSICHLDGDVFKGLH